MYKKLKLKKQVQNSTNQLKVIYVDRHCSYAKWLHQITEIFLDFKKNKYNFFCSYLFFSYNF